MANRLRVGVLGAGAWAHHAHIPGWQRDPRCEVVAICDVDRGKAEAYAAEFGIAEASDDWQAVVARADLDIIDIVTPSHTHYELSVAAIEAGKHVLCEKPVAYDFRQTRAVAATARQKGLKTKLGFTFRYSPGVQSRGRHLIRHHRPADSLPMNASAVATLQPSPTVAAGVATLRRNPSLWLRLRHNRSALIGGSVLLLIILIAILAPLASPYDPIKTNQRLSLAPPSIDHFMGTDRFGRDIFSRVMWAGQTSLNQQANQR